MEYMLRKHHNDGRINFSGCFRARRVAGHLPCSIFFLVILLLHVGQSRAQCPTPKEIYDKLLRIENADDGYDVQLRQANALRNQFDKCGFEKDSVYARLLHKIGVYQYFSTKQINEAIENTLLAAKINTSGKKNASREFAIGSYWNLGFYFFELAIYSKSILYFDSAISIGRSYPAEKGDVLNAWIKKCNAFFKKGDYEKAVSEATLVLRSVLEPNDSLYIIQFLLERAQALLAESKTGQAAADIKSALALCTPTIYNNVAESYDNLANIYRYQGDVFASDGLADKAVAYYKKAIDYRMKLGTTEQLAVDYNDLGYLLRMKRRDLPQAQRYFSLSYQTAVQLKITNTCALAQDNLSQVSFDRGKYEEAMKQSHAALQLLAPNFRDETITANPDYASLSNADERNLLDLLENRVKCMLCFHKQSSNITYLQSCIKTALLADSVITNFRHAHVEEESKLYWRDETRKFFSNALEASYLMNDPSRAFFFLEKSRAVLLNDRLNEIGASKHLPPEEEAKQQRFLIDIVEEQRRLAELDKTSKQFAQQQIKLLQAKEDFEHYIKSLEQKYPAYYQYKYADDVPSLNDLQQYIAKNNQSFVHYFIGDTVSYILAITAQSTKFIRLAQKDFNREQLITFLQMCSDKEKLNSQYPAFAAMANSIYRAIFEKLQLPKGRVVICADNFLIPFDALCDDSSGRHFLLNDYSFSYVYSARYLMKQFNNSAAVGNFLGFAPVSFASYLQMPELKDAADALHASASYYNSDKLFTGQDATRSNFFNYASSYSVVSVFSHAIADTSGSEPKIFMHDSVIFLSDLQRLNNPAARLVLLSACQTNIGKNATGEGVYSLARGFSSAGIPSVVATMWSADEQMIYAITEKLNEYLSKGMSKDEALQKAKLYFIQNNGGEKLLPYYWANVVLIGNTDAINLATKQNNYWWWVAGIGLAVFVAAIIFLRKKRALKVI
jgi:CHAT domain-containing protein/tetratricopeptide (TPR) repeat protein